MVSVGGEGFVSGEFGELFVSDEDEDEDPDSVPLCSINPGIEWPNNSFDWC